MFSYIWPITMVIISNIIYQICAKFTSEGADPLASLTITYTVAALISLILFFVLNREGNLLKEYSQVNWAPFVFGLTLVGLEVGYIYAYRAGWNVSTASVIQGTFVTIGLIFVGYFLFKESITLNKILGIIICTIGLYFINK